MLLPSALIACLSVVPGQEPTTATEQPAPQVQAHAALDARLRALAKAHPSRVTALELGRSRGARSIPGLRIADGEIAPGRPGILVVANIEGPQVFSSALVLWQIERLLERAESDARVAEFLATTTLYVIPRVAPDAAEARFAVPLAEVEATGSGVDNDRDGRAGEDPPSDVNGDGLITSMRVPDPEGRWIPDPTDARASIQADAVKGERGRFRLEIEGRDADGDEQVSEDSPHDARISENFASEWDSRDGRGGLFPMDEPEARALADFLIERTDVVLVVTYGTLDNLVDAPKSVKPGAPDVLRVPPQGLLEPDAQLLAELGKRRAKTGAGAHKGRGSFAGSFPAWAYDHRGLFSLAICPWDIPLDAKGLAPAEKSPAEPAKDGETPPDTAKEPEESDTDAADKSGEKAGKDKPDKDEPKPSDDAKRLLWCDEHGEGARFLPWTSFEHPELGAVEIGGWRPQARNEPPEDVAREVAEHELDFLLGLGALLPRLDLVELEGRELGAGLVEVRAVLENPSLLPLRSASARRTETVRAARVRLVLPEGARLIAGRNETLVDELAGSGGRRELRWLVAGAAVGSVGIEVDSTHAGHARATVEVVR